MATDETVNATAGEPKSEHENLNQSLGSNLRGAQQIKVSIEDTKQIEIEAEPDSSSLMGWFSRAKNMVLKKQTFVVYVIRTESCVTTSHSFFPFTPADAVTERRYSEFETLYQILIQRPELKGLAIP